MHSTTHVHIILLECFRLYGLFALFPFLTCKMQKTQQKTCTSSYASLFYIVNFYQNVWSLGGGCILRKQAITYMKKNSQQEKILGTEWGEEGEVKKFGGKPGVKIIGGPLNSVFSQISQKNFPPAAGQNVWGGGALFSPEKKLTLIVFFFSNF